jgi:hypothetical protein
MHFPRFVHLVIASYFKRTAKRLVLLFARFQFKFTCRSLEVIISVALVAFYGSMLVLASRIRAAAISPLAQYEARTGWFDDSP